jgi:hypothetical protein
MKYRLGRKPAKFTRQSFMRSHVLARHLAALGPLPTASPDWVSAVMKQSPGGWGMMGNDEVGDCTCADCGHTEMLRTANTGAIWIPSTQDVLSLYSAITGYNPNDPSTDQGANELDVIQYLIQTGWNGRKLDGSANIDPSQLDHVKWAVCLFGACRLGVNLPQSAEDAFNAGQPWDVGDDEQPVGGHDVPIVKYDSNGIFWVVTWGKLQAVTQDFMLASFPDGTPYVEEAHAELAYDWVSSVGTAPSRFDLNQLITDLSEITN